MSGFSCKGCTERYVGCHSTCRAYKDAKEVHDKNTSAIREARRKEGSITAYFKSQALKNAR